MSDINERLLYSMADLKVSNAKIDTNIEHIQNDMEETKDGIKLVHRRIDEVGKRTNDLEGGRDVEHGKSKTWKIVGGIIAASGVIAGILAAMGAFS